jgi:hypothetical protein
MLSEIDEFFNPEDVTKYEDTITNEFMNDSAKTIDGADVESAWDPIPNSNLESGEVT